MHVEPAWLPRKRLIAGVYYCVIEYRNVETAGNLTAGSQEVPRIPLQDTLEPSLGAR